MPNKLTKKEKLQLVLDIVNGQLIKSQEQVVAAFKKRGHQISSSAVDEYFKKLLIKKVDGFYEAPRSAQNIINLSDLEKKEKLQLTLDLVNYIKPITSPEQVVEAFKQRDYKTSSWCVKEYFDQLFIKKVDGIYEAPHFSQNIINFLGLTKKEKRHFFQNIINGSKPITSLKQVAEIFKKQNGYSISLKSINNCFKELGIKKIDWVYQFQSPKSQAQSLASIKRDNKQISDQSATQSSLLTKKEKLQFTLDTLNGPKPIIKKIQIIEVFEQRNCQISLVVLDSYLALLKVKIIDKVFTAPPSAQGIIDALLTQEEKMQFIKETVNDFVSSFEPIPTPQEMVIIFKFEKKHEISEESIRLYFEKLGIKKIDGVYQFQQSPPNKDIVLKEKEEKKDDDGTNSPDMTGILQTTNALGQKESLLFSKPTSRNQNADKSTVERPLSNIVILPRIFTQPQHIIPQINQSQTGRVVQFPIVQQQNTGIFAKAAGAETLRFSPPFNNSIVELQPRGPVTTNLSSRMRTSYTPPTTGTERAGRIVVLPPAESARAPLAQSSFAKGVGYYMIARVGFSAANEIGRTNGGYQPWSTTGKNLTRIGEGVAVSLVLAWALPTTALVLGCGIIVHDGYHFFNPPRPKVRLYRVPSQPLKPGGLITLSGPIRNKLKKPISVEMLSHATRSLATPIGRIQICPDPNQPLDKRVTRLMKQAGYHNISNPYGDTSFNFSYNLSKSSDLPTFETSQIRLECKTVYRESLPHIMGTSLDQEKPKVFTMAFSEQQSYPGLITVIYPHFKSNTKPYVVVIDVAKQQMVVNYHHARPSEEITTYVARTIVPEKWLRWKVDSTVAVTIDYRNADTTPKITVNKSGMQICQPITELFSYSSKKVSTDVGAKSTITNPLNPKTSNVPMIFSGK